MLHAKTQSSSFIGVRRLSGSICRAHGFIHGFTHRLCSCIFFSYSLFLINNFHIAAAGVDVRVAIFAHFNFALYQSTLFQADTRA